jgi:hypothetical protein
MTIASNTFTLSGPILGANAWIMEVKIAQSKRHIVDEEDECFVEPEENDTPPNSIVIPSITKFAKDYGVQVLSQYKEDPFVAVTVTVNLWTQTITLTDLAKEEVVFGASDLRVTI